MSARLLSRLGDDLAGLPGDRAMLLRYLDAASGVLAGIAGTLEANWPDAERSLAEIDGIQRLQAGLLEKLAAMPARDLGDVVTKLRIWAASWEGADEMSAEDKLVLGALRDLEDLAGASPSEE